MPLTRTGLRRKIRFAFLLQAAAIAVVAVLCVVAGTWLMRELLVERALHDEAAYIRTRLASDPAAVAPDTYRLDAWVLHSPAERTQLPTPMQSLPPGFARLPAAAGGDWVLVDVQAGAPDIVVSYRPGPIDRTAVWMLLVPATILISTLYLICWLAYRFSKRAVAPVVWLADQVRDWDPKRPQSNALAPENLPDDVEDESLVLANSLHGYAHRIDDFVARERNFTRDASHELRTPLAVIRVAGDLIAADAALSPLSRRALVRIQGAGRDMEALIEAFLILAREGDTGLPDDEFVVGDILDEEVQKARIMLGARPVDLLLVKEVDFHLRAPARVLAVIVANLLRNAVQHTDHGRITVTLAQGVITIQDTGVGMDADALAHAFDAYWPGHPHDEGRGLGLSLVRRLSRRYGWRIELASEPQQGTRATLTIPPPSPRQ